MSPNSLLPTDACGARPAAAIARVAILGASGQVGLSLVRRLAAQPGCAVTGICRSPLSATRVAHTGAEVVVPTEPGSAALAEALGEFDVVVNCALPGQGPARNARENAALAEALIGVGRRTAVLHLSSVAVYGNAFIAGATSFTRPCPEDRYGREKLAMERRLRRLAAARGVRLWIGRLGHVWGPELNWSRILLRLAADPEFRVPFDGMKPSNAIAIDNLAAAVAWLAARRPPAGTWNLVDRPQHSWRELLDLHSVAAGRLPVDSMSASESLDRYAQLCVGRGHGLAWSLATDLGRWLRALPASFVASSPALQGVAESLLARTKSAALESRLKAIYWRATTRPRAAAPSGSLACMASDAVPGPCLEYSGAATKADLPALTAYADAISQPLASPVPCLN
jgi:nucleoside-diphosphate-sugar epimerase